MDTHIASPSINTNKNLAKQMFFAKTVNNFCKDFFYQTKINSFSYSRVFPDGSRSELWSNSYAMEHTFCKKYISALYTPDLYDTQDKFVYLPEKIISFNKEISSCYTKQLADQKLFFDYDHPFIIINKNNLLVEYFIFYISANSKSPYNFYLNHLQQLLIFTNEFTKHFKTLILESDTNKIVMPWRNNKNNHIVSKEQNNILRLTPRESQVLCQTMQGLTAKEIAKNLNLSFRTIEDYIKNIKLRYNCKKKSELITKAFERHSYDFLFHTRANYE